MGSKLAIVVSFVVLLRGCSESARSGARCACPEAESGKCVLIQIPFFLPPPLAGPVGCYLNVWTDFFGLPLTHRDGSF